MIFEKGMECLSKLETDTSSDTRDFSALQPSIVKCNSSALIICLRCLFESSLTSVGCFL